jgi:hypothetical protein
MPARCKALADYPSSRRSPTLRSHRWLQGPSRFANSVAERSGLACGTSNRAFLPPTSATAWAPIRISRTSRMSMAADNGETRAATARVGPSTTPCQCTSIRALTSPWARCRPSQPHQYRRQSRHSRQLVPLHHVAF